MTHMTNASDLTPTHYTCPLACRSRAPFHARCRDISPTQSPWRPGGAGRRRDHSPDYLRVLSGLRCSASKRIWKGVREYDSYKKIKMKYKQNIKI